MSLCYCVCDKTAERVGVLRLAYFDSMDKERERKEKWAKMRQQRDYIVQDSAIQLTHNANVLMYALVPGKLLIHHELTK